MNKIVWKHIDYNNDSLNSIARNITEYHTAHALTVKYSTTKGVPIGTIFLDVPRTKQNTVENISALNSILNYNVYFKENTEVPLKTIIDPDCVVALASGDTPSQLLAKHTYVIDISPIPGRPIHNLKLFTTLSRIRIKYINSIVKSGIFCCK